MNYTNRLKRFAGWTRYRDLSFPHRVYFHEEGLDLHPGIKGQKPIYQVREIAKEMLMAHYSGIKTNLPLWLITAVWTDKVDGKNQVILDMFENREVDEWPGNPSILGFNIPRNPDGVNFCGDTSVLIDREEEFREGTRNLTHYFDEHPELNDKWPFYWAIPHILGD